MSKWFNFPQGLWPPFFIGFPFRYFDPLFSASRSPSGYGLLDGPCCDRAPFSRFGDRWGEFFLGPSPFPNSPPPETFQEALSSPVRTPVLVSPSRSRRLRLFSFPLDPRHEYLSPAPFTAAPVFVSITFKGFAHRFFRRTHRSWKISASSFLLAPGTRSCSILRAPTRSRAEWRRSP